MDETDAFLATRLRAATRFRELVHVGTCASTQDLAAARGPAHDAVFWADHQTAGRGRQHRPWDDASGLDLAVTFRSRLSLPNPVALPAVVPLCVLRAVRSRTDLALDRRLRLKWPNDVLLDDRKLAGVLIDAGASGPGSFSIGVGINVNRTHLPRELEAIATSLALATGREHDRHELLLALALELDASITVLERADAGGLAALEADYVRRLGLVGRAVQVDSGVLRTGELVALDFRELRLSDGTRLPLGQVRGLRPA